MMTKSKRKRMMKYRQKELNRSFAYLLVMNLLIVAFIVTTAFMRTSGKNQIEDGYYLTVYESKVAEVSNQNENNDHNTVTPPANVLTNLDYENINNTNEQNDTGIADSNKITRGLSEEDKYLLAKIAMAEAEGESLEAKVMVIFVVLNRVESNEPYFPDTVEDVIFQKLNGAYQFTPVGDGRWDRVEPNTECWEAVDIVNSTENDISQGALYFEACSGESWHSRNLEFICQVDNTRFYK